MMDFARLRDLAARIHAMADEAEEHGEATFWMFFTQNIEDLVGIFGRKTVKK